MMDTNQNVLDKVEILSPLAERKTTRYAESSPTAEPGEIKMEIKALSVYYGVFRALQDINIQIPARNITAIIGPSGCGKSTMLRSLNRMNDLTPRTRIEGEVNLDGVNIYSKNMHVRI